MEVSSGPPGSLPCSSLTCHQRHPGVQAHLPLFAFLSPLEGGERGRMPWKSNPIQGLRHPGSAFPTWDAPPWCRPMSNLVFMYRCSQIDLTPPLNRKVGSCSSLRTGQMLQDVSSVHGHQYIRLGTNPQWDSFSHSFKYPIQNSSYPDDLKTLEKGALQLPHHS